MFFFVYFRASEKGIVCAKARLRSQILASLFRADLWPEQRNNGERVGILEEKMFLFCQLWWFKGPHDEWGKGRRSSSFWTTLIRPFTTTVAMNTPASSGSSRLQYIYICSCEVYMAVLYIWQIVAARDNAVHGISPSAFAHKAKRFSVCRVLSIRQGTCLGYRALHLSGCPFRLICLVLVETSWEMKAGPHHKRPLHFVG